MQRTSTVLTLADMPHEIMVHVFSFLSGKDVAFCAGVCKLWRELCKENDIWKKFCEKNGYTVFWIEPKDRISTSINWLDVYRWYKECTERHLDPQDTQKEGKATVHWSNGTVYCGEFKANKKEGKGKHKWPDNSRYEGEWMNDSRNGFGTYFWPDGRYFEGYHVNDKRTWGAFFWPPGKSEKQGAKYVGEYVTSLRQGRGTFYWPDGDFYEGEWVQGARYGEGKYYCNIEGDYGIYKQTWAETTFDYYFKGPKTERVGKRKFDNDSVSWTEIPDEVKQKLKTPTKSIPTDVLHQDLLTLQPLVLNMNIDTTAPVAPTDEDLKSQTKALVLTTSQLSQPTSTVEVVETEPVVEEIEVEEDQDNPTKRRKSNEEKKD